MCTVLADILHPEIPQDPILFLLLDDSTHQKRTLLAVGTAAKNTVLKDTTTSTTFTWLSYFRDITLIEGTTCQA